MSLKTTLIQIRDAYVRNQVDRLSIPQFPSDETVRYRITFSGRVQHVGFRYEIGLLANRLHLTGWCRNLENGDVLAEIQGPNNQIHFLISFMESLKRVRIREKIMEQIALQAGETTFLRKD